MEKNLQNAYEEYLTTQSFFVAVERMCGGGNEEFLIIIIYLFNGSRKQWTGKWELCSDSNNKSHLFVSPVAAIYTGSAYTTVQRSLVSSSYENDQFLFLPEQSKSTWDTENSQIPS